MDEWHKRFLKLAEHIAGWSKDPSSKIGAVIVDRQNRIVSTGFNGFPVGIADDERLNDRDTKYKMVLHAEENAIIFAQRDLSECRLYVSGLPPCPHCASLIIQSGIKEVYIPLHVVPERWREAMELSVAMLDEAKVNVIVVAE